jgi:hypothetical protein
MQNQDGNDAAARRRTVSKRLRRSFAELTVQLAAGTAEIWARVEQRLAQRTTSETPIPPPYATQPMQQQPLQQQQSKAEPEGEKKA